MKSYIALIRGINVGGRKKLPMAALRKSLTTHGLHDVLTYIQSGNLIFKTLEGSIDTLESLIKTSILNDFGYEVPVLIKTESQLKTILEACPFEGAEKEASYFSLLKSFPTAEAIGETSKMSFPDETFKITTSCVYSFSKNSYGKAKANNNYFEDHLKVSATTRNYKTMQKLVSLASENKPND